MPSPHTSTGAAAPDPVAGKPSSGVPCAQRRLGCKKRGGTLKTVWGPRRKWCKKLSTSEAATPSDRNRGGERRV